MIFSTCRLTTTPKLNLALCVLADTPDGQTRLDVVFRYSLPGGMAGKLLGAVVEPVVGQAIRHTESALRSQLEAAQGR